MWYKMEFLESPSDTYFTILPSDLLNSLKLYFILSYPVIYAGGPHDYDQYYQSLDMKWYTVYSWLWKGYDSVVDDANYDLFKADIAQLLLRKNAVSYYYAVGSRKFKLTFYINGQIDNIDHKIIAFIINNPRYYPGSDYDDEVYLINNKEEVTTISFQ